MNGGECIGILGGMGSAATVHLFQQIVKNTGAKGDGEHIPVIVYNNTQIPDRTAAIFNQGPSPLPHLIEGACFLERANVSRIVIPCVTAHHYFDKIVHEVNIPVAHLLRETLEFVIEKYPAITRLGLLATSGTLKTKLFSDLFSSRSRDIVIPAPAQQERVMEAIYGSQGIKNGHLKSSRKILLQVIQHLARRGAQAVIAGCTEIPLVIKAEHLTLPYIDPLLVIARKLILTCGYRLKDV